MSNNSSYDKMASLYQKYGGTLTYIGFGTRSIRDIAVNDLKEKGN